MKHRFRASFNLCSPVIICGRLPYFTHYRKHILMFKSNAIISQRSNRALAAIAVVLFLLASLAFSVASPTQQEAPPALTQTTSRQAKRALVISLDGLDARYLHQRDKFGLRIPTLRRLMAEGATARGMITVYPSLTYPAHTAMVTGALPARHGIFGNSLFEPPGTPQTGGAHWFAQDIRVDTLWDAASRERLLTGMVSWPVAGGAGDYNIPEIWSPGGTIEESRAVIAKYARPRGLLEEAKGRVPDIYRNVNEDEGDDARTRFAEFIITEKRPELMFVHLFDLDHFEHDYGPFTTEAFAMLEKSDGYVARLLAAAERAGTLKETAVFIVSDHGFMSISKQVHPGVLLARAGLLEVREEKDAQGRVRARATNWRAMFYVTGGACAIILRDENDQDALNKIRAIFEPLAKQKESGILRVLNKEEIRELGSNTRAALMLEGAEGYSFGGNLTGEVITESRSRGTHGYLPTRPDYYASFIASGAGITKRGDIGLVNMIDIGPTIAHLLRLTLRDAEGRILPIE